MSVLQIIIISIGLAMDAFAVSVCKGLSLKKIKTKHILMVGLYFGFFQAIMPVIGYTLGHKFKDIASNFNRCISFILLLLIGSNMIKEAYEENEKLDDSFKFKEMISLAIATSIDALTVGITFAFFNINIFFAITLIGIITFILSIIGLEIGNIFGRKYNQKAKVFGGIILILMGIKFLI